MCNSLLYSHSPTLTFQRYDHWRWSLLWKRLKSNWEISHSNIFPLTFQHIVIVTIIVTIIIRVVVIIIVVIIAIVIIVGIDVVILIIVFVIIVVIALISLSLL